MSELTNEVCELIERTTEEEHRFILSYLRQRVPIHALEAEWNTTAEEILTSIARSPDITQRGIRGILAEAIFEKRILPCLEHDGWRAAVIVGEQPYDFLLEKGTVRVTIQVKLQRKEEGQPKVYSARCRKALVDAPGKNLYVVEVQKTRTGKTRSGDKKGEDSRPYHFGDFDILAVNLHTSTGDWNRFMYTVGDWLLPREKEALIEIMNPVPLESDAYWTDDLRKCIGWFLLKEKRRIYGGTRKGFKMHRPKKIGKPSLF